ncbi:PREDICTED: uncharacterized protein LOC105368183 isoform X2 [Ceratosolen solmsi marchali]|uniref:Uncharacterized protein LOC105368183 isoform X2 n=1 Tax=Ceratosolen solmsi marchali TaxID=326594 RepID=A0AAJ6YVY7_9HYME|nr:PREDICTED: uncharacterized protein LOC105368183 isoform X2 [Ceratosolen solmsi marchali]
MQEIYENLRRAIEHGRTDIVMSILDACDENEISNGITKDKILNGPIFEEGTPLLYASIHNQVDLVRTLLNCGADPAVTNMQGLNALEVSINDKIRQIYIEELLRATAASEISRVQQLLSVGINVNSWDSKVSRNTPLHWAACYSNKDMVQYLIDKGADINMENGCGTTPLHEAVNRGEIEICQILLKSGSNPFIRAIKGTFSGKSAYDIAKNNSSIECLIEKYLVEMPLKDKENVHNCLELVEDTNFSQKNILVDIHQPLTVDSIKSLENSLEVSASAGDSRESGSDSPLRIQRSIANTGLYEMIWPEPKYIIELGHISPPFIVEKELLISIIQGSESIHKILDVWEISRTHLLELGCDVKIGEVQPQSGRISYDKRIECIVNPKLFNVTTGYQLHITQNSIKVSAGSLAGLHYAVCTFVQILRLCKNRSNNTEICEIEAVLIKDEPRFGHRGILLDISLRGRTPTLEYLLHAIDVWCSFKLSHLHLYFRLTPSCDWQFCYSKSEMVTLDRYCRDRYLELVPALDVDSNVSLQHLSQMWPLFQELLTTFPNVNYVHIGPRLASILVQPSNFDCSLSIDETIERDMSEVLEPYSNLQQLWHILNLNFDTTVLLCSNGLHSKLEFRSIPNNIILVEYGFQADYEFSNWTEAFRVAGANILPSSGTASYNSLAGCPASTYANTKNAIKTAQEQDSIGIVVAHWSGSHYLTSHTFAWVGYIIAAGLSWNPSTDIDLEPSIDFYDTRESIGNNSKKSIARILDTYVFRDLEYKIGSAILELGRVDTLVLTRATKQIKRVSHALYEANPTSKFAFMEIQELQLAADLILTACKIGKTLIGVGINPNSNMGLAVINLGVNNLPPTFRTDIANKMLAHIERYKGVWLQRHLPQGLQTSLLILTSALHRFVPES